MKTLRDTWLFFQRHMLLLTRSPLSILLGVAQPFMPEETLFLYDVSS